MEAIDTSTITISVGMLITLAGGVAAWTRALARIEQLAKTVDQQQTELREITRELSAQRIAIVRTRERQRSITDVFPTVQPSSPTPVHGLRVERSHRRSDESGSDL